MTTESRDFAAAWLGENVGKGDPIEPESAETVAFAHDLEHDGKKQGFSRKDIENDYGCSLESLACFSFANKFEIRDRSDEELLLHSTRRLQSMNTKIPRTCLQFPQTP